VLGYICMNDVPDRYAVVGYPVQHSWSPFIHAMFAKQTGQAITYNRLEIAPQHFVSEVQRFFEQGGKGLNITLPHKQAARALSGFCTPRAEMAGAVNTLLPQEGRLLGDNTDGAGLIADLTRNLGLELRETRILLLGAGGAARGVVGPLLGTGPAYLEIVNRNGERASALAQEFAALGNVHGCEFAAATDSAFDLVLNATAASLQDAVPPVPAGAVTEQTLCYDMGYGLGDTAFTQWAKQHGAGHAVTGWGMLVEQAAESFQLWRGIKPQTRPVLNAILERGAERKTAP
jgi:shikimate dehydrogenase